MESIFYTFVFIGKVWLIISIISFMYLVKVEYEKRNQTFYVGELPSLILIAMFWPYLLKISLRNEIPN